MENNMSSIFESIQQGLIEAVDYSEGQTKNATVHKYLYTDTYIYMSEPTNGLEHIRNTS